MLRSTRITLLLGSSLPKISKPRKNSTVSVAGRKRFYKVVGTKKCAAPECTTTADEENAWLLWTPRGKTTTTADWHTVTLDSKPLRTPAGSSLVVPSLPLALSLAVEWDSQRVVISPVQMPLMTSVCTALDQTWVLRTQIIQKCMQFLFNDTTCYFTDENDDRVLFARQKKHWRTLHEYVHAVTGQRPAALSSSSGAAAGFGNLPHPDELVHYCTNYVTQLDIWHLTALNTIATETKSLLIAIAALQGDFHVMKDIHNVVHAGRVEEEFQIENWGLVEGGHDYDRLNASISIGAARTMLDLIHK